MDQNPTISREAPEHAQSEFNVISFIFRQLLRQVNTFQPAKVLSCTNSGGVSPVGYLDVQLLVNQVDGGGNAVDNAVIHNIPYCRVQGGVNAIICDPMAGDIGFVAFAQRDINSFKNTKNKANPGSPREFSLADAVWIGGWPANVAPQVYVRFDQAGSIAIVATKDIALNCSAGTASVTSTTLNANVSGNASVTVGGTTTLNSTGAVSVTAPSVAVSTSSFTVN